MKKIRKNPFGLAQRNENKRIQADNKVRLSHIRRKLTRGAANIFRVIQSRAKWGNKHLWGTEKSEHRHKHYQVAKKKKRD